MHGTAGRMKRSHPARLKMTRVERFAVTLPTTRHTLIIVPLRAEHDRLLADLASCYRQISREVPGTTIVVVDNSTTDLYQTLDVLLADSGVLHMRPSYLGQLALNKKMGNVLSVAERYDFAGFDAILLFDDDMRPCGADVLAITAAHTGARIVTSPTVYAQPDIFDTIDTAGLHCVNFLTRGAQIWGNLSFDGHLLGASDFTRYSLCDTVFDELTLLRHLRTKGGVRVQLNGIEVSMLGSQRSLAQFVEQRIRYAYENIAIPVVNVASLTMLPILVLIFYAMSLSSAISTTLVLSLLPIPISFLGLVSSCSSSPRAASLLAPVWMLSYVLASWMANLYYLVGGYPRSGQRIRRPA